MRSRIGPRFELGTDPDRRVVRRYEIQTGEVNQPSDARPPSPPVGDAQVTREATSSQACLAGQFGKGLGRIDARRERKHRRRPGAASGPPPTRSRPASRRRGQAWVTRSSSSRSWSGREARGEGRTDVRASTAKSNPMGISIPGWPRVRRASWRFGAALLPRPSGGGGVGRRGSNEVTEVARAWGQRRLLCDGDGCRTGRHDGPHGASAHRARWAGASTISARPSCVLFHRPATRPIPGGHGGRGDSRGPSGGAGRHGGRGPAESVRGAGGPLTGRGSS